MQYLKRNTKYSILAFLVIVLSITISISTLAKTEVYSSLCDTPQILSTISPKPKVQTININTASQDEFLNILYISEPLARKIIDLPFISFPRTRGSIISREEMRGFKEPKDLMQLPEVTNPDWRGLKKEGMIFNFE